MLQFGVTILPDPPYTRFLELAVLAEQAGFDQVWTYDSHILWHDAYPLLALAADRTERIMLGHCVTNPGIRDPTVTASSYATLQAISKGRMVLGIGRGDSSRRVIGLEPVPMREFEDSLKMIKKMMHGEQVDWNGKELELVWAHDLGRIPMQVAAYGPKALAVAGRVGDGVVVQLADPDLTKWFMDQAGAAAKAAGRDVTLECIVSAPAFISDDMELARSETRWFPAMVSNHVVDLLTKTDPATLPPALTEYVSRRKFYDYKDHSRRGAQHGEFVDDETCDAFSVLGTVEQHIAKLEKLVEAGMTQFNIYLMTQGQEQILDTYRTQIIPHFR
jgi:probable F420-dependent oxidoreductase